MTTPLTGLTGRIQLSINLSSESYDGINTVVDPLSVNQLQLIAYGDDAPLADLVHREHYEVDYGTPVQIDLQDIPTAFGYAGTFDSLLAIVLVNSGTIPVEVGASGDNANLPIIGAVTDLVAVVAADDGTLYLSDFASGEVIDSSHSLLTFTAQSAGTAEFDLYLVGISVPAVSVPD